MRSLVEEIARLVAAGKFDSRELFEAREKLAWLIRLEPGVLEELRDLVRDGSLDPTAATVILSAVGKAAVSDAQAFLGELVAGSDLAEHLRVAAVQSLFQVAESIEPVRAAVIAAAKDSDGPLALQGTAMLLLGALASQGPAGGEKAASEHLAGILQLEDSARERGITDVWLEALGNSGLPGVLDRARPYLSDPDENIRVSAIQALRSVDTPDATAALIATARAETSVLVRSAAAEILAARAGRDAMEPVAWWLQNDADESVRRACLLGPAARLDLDPEASRLVQWAATSDRTAEIRALARDFLRQDGAR